MSLLNQFMNKVSYTLHNITYDPEAEEFAKEKQKEIDKTAAEIKAQKEATEAKIKAEEEKKEADKKAAQERKEAEDEEERNSFSILRLLGRIFGILFLSIGVFFLFLLGVYGSSLATNLNVHKDLPYRVLYAIWGFLFFWLVIPYVLIYRWWWNTKRPRFYALIPLVPYRFDNYYAAMFLSWMSYKPDDIIEELKEWE